MAARTVAAALLSSTWMFLYVLFVCLSCTDCQTEGPYSQQDLLKIGTLCSDLDFVRQQYREHIQPEISRSAGSPWITIPGSSRKRRRRERRQKRGCRSGVQTRLKKAPHKPTLPSIFLSNARSLINKMDELMLITESHKSVRDCSIMVITESWLHTGIPDEAVALPGRTVHRADRNGESGKKRGGGLCIYSNNKWCSNATVIERHCSPDVEFITLRCRPFHLPREFTVVFVMAVYIPPSANKKSALNILLTAISKLQNAHPDGIYTIAGDFNQANLKTVLPKFFQHVTCATRGKNILDHVYSNIKGGYKVTTHPHLGQSDHLSIFLSPAYRPLIKKTVPRVKCIRTWPEDASSQLQDCFEGTQWDLFSHEDVNVYTFTVLSYVQYCVDNVTVNKQVRCYLNNKPWMNRDVKLLLRERDIAFRSGNKDLYSSARSNLKRGIKAAYGRKIEGHFDDARDPRRVWQGIQHLTNYKGREEPPPPPVPAVHRRRRN